MPTEAQSDIQKLSPEKLLKRFNKSGIVLCVIAAFAAHVVVLGGTSVDYIHGLVDPAWREEQDRLAEEARKAAQAERLAARGVAPTTGPTTRRATRPTSRPAASQPASRPGRRLPEALTTMPKPGEIPTAPGAGVSIDETDGK